jgi:hypothetical protein
MPEIKNRINCSFIEINNLKDYLATTPVGWLNELIDNHATVSKGRIESLLEVGKTRTIWGDLGGIQSKNEYGSEKFLVGQIIPVLKKPLCSDRTTLNKILEYIQLFADNKLELKITLLEVNNQFTICDGNTRVVACFEYWSKCGINDVNLPVYVITQS